MLPSLYFFMAPNIFEQIKRINKYDSEYWSARELARILKYSDYRNFENAIEKAKVSCQNSDQMVSAHFGDVTEPQKSSNQYGEIKGQIISDCHLSRYACYLIAQNGDPRKEEIALAQTYFALQTRRQELQELLDEDRKRVFLRGEMTDKNKKLAHTAKGAGVSDYANFQDYGYMGLYNGLRQRDIHRKKKLKPQQKILDHMGSEELSANWFRATQTEAKIKRENIFGQEKANSTHFHVGKKVRQTIRELGGTMPEKLPNADAIKKSRKRLKNFNIHQQQQIDEKTPKELIQLP